MTRIGIDARLTYYRHGGIASYIRHLIETLPMVDADNDYLILHQRKDSRNLALGANQRKVRCWTPSHHRLERLAMAVEVLPLGLDILHSPDFIPPMGGRYKSVITIHDLTFLHYPEFLTADSKRYYNGQIDSAVKRADHIMTDSEATRRDVLSLLDVPEDKVTTVLLGISDHFQPASQEIVTAFTKPNGLPDDYLLFVGTFEPRKNLSGLLDAYQMLRDSYSDAPKLVLTGQKGWLFEEISTKFEQFMQQGAVQWLENVAFDDLPALYSGAHALILPSFYEGFGFPPLEAMACGTPVIVSNRASLPEVVGDAGIQVEADDAEALAEAIMRILSDTALADDLVQRGLARAKIFSWEKTAREVLDVYQRVLHER